MTTDPTVISTKRSGRRFRRIILFGVGCFICSAAITVALVYRYYTDPARVHRIASDLLQRHVSDSARIESATFTWNQGLRLHGVTVSEPPHSTAPSPNPTDQRRPVLTCPEVDIRLSPWQLLFGQFDVQSVSILGPTLYVARDSVVGTTNIEEWIRTWRPTLRTSPSAHPPVIEVQNARIIVAQRNRSNERIVENLTLNVRARPSKADAGQLDLVWETIGTPSARGQSTLHLRTATLTNVEGGLPWMSLEAVMIGINAGVDKAGNWSDLLGLDGKVRAVDYRLGASPGDLAMRSAVIELEQASLSIPVNEQEQDLDPSQRYLRFSDVDGTIALRADRLETRFDGRLHDGAVRVSATLQGLNTRLHSLNDVTLDATVSLTGLTLPSVDADAPEAQRRFVGNWPRLVKIYQEYDPHGRADLEFEIAKPEGTVDDLVVRRFIVTARGGDARQENFPYRVTNLNGSVEYSSGGITLKQLCGSHDEGRVCVDGWVAEGMRCAPIELQILGQDIAIDDDLAEAVPRWLHQVRADFSPVGKIDLLIEIRRHACVDYQPAKWEWSSEVTFADLSAMYRDIPYPLDELAGRIVINDKVVRVDEVRGFAGESPLRLSGTVNLRKNAQSEVDLDLEILDLPIDEELYCALGEQTASALRSWHPRGTADFLSRIVRRRGNAHLSHDTTVLLNGVSLMADSFPIPIENAFGVVRVTDNVLRFEQMTGRLNSGTISVVGSVPREATAGDIDLFLHAQDITFDESVRRALPPGTKDALADLSVDGRVSADVNLRGELVDGQVQVSHATKIFLNGVDVQHARLPLPLTDVRGVIKVEGDRADTQGLTARIGSAFGRARFQFSNDDGSPQVDASGEVHEVKLDESVRDMLPERVRKSWANLGPTGLAELRINRLRVARADDNARITVFITAEIELLDAELRGDFEAKDIRGHVAVEGWLVDSEGCTRLNGTLSVEHLQVALREAGQVYSPWTFVANESGSGRLALGPATGTMYDGTITANAEFTFLPDSTTYVYSLMGHQIKLEPFHNASLGPAGSEREPADIRGSVNAFLQVSGTTGDPASRRGTGSVEIVDGFLYRLPLIVAVLNVVNLKVPQKDHFDDAHAEFFVAGNKIQIEQLSLQSREIALVGKGTMSLPDYTVDLKLANLKPLRWANVPILEDVVGGVSRSLVELQVTGPLTRPNVRTLPLGALTDELKTLFQKRKPKRIQPLDR